MARITSGISALLTTLGLVGSAQAITLTEVARADRDGACTELATDTPASSAIEAELVDAHLARCLLDEGDFDGAVEAMDRLDRSLSRSGHDIDAGLHWLAETRARVALISGDVASAVETFRGLVREAGRDQIDQGSRARHLYYLSLSLEAAGSVDEAAGTRRSLVMEYPASPYVSRLAPQLAELRLEPGETLELAETALAGRHYPLAERLFSLVVCPELADAPWDDDAGFDFSAAPAHCAPEAVADSGSRDAYEAAYQLGFMLYRYRREFVDRSVPWLRALAEEDGRRQANALHTLARSYMRMEAYDEALEVWSEFASRFPDDRRRHEATYYAGWLPFDHDQHAEAIDGLRDYLDEYPDGARHEGARWALGWAYYRTGDFSRAQRTWRVLERRSGWRDQARYWQAVAYHAQGETEVAEDLWEELREDPYTYYGVLASRRLGLPLVPGVEDRFTGDVARPLDMGGVPVVSVARSGLISEARLIAQYDPVGGMLDPDLGVDTEVWEMWTEADRRDWSRWHRSFSRYDTAVPTDLGELVSWRLAHPIFYDQVVQDEAFASGIRPSLVWAIMRRESSYDPNALSHSDAMGLMQVIPQTATRIADRVADRYVDGILFEPYYAVAYGSWYLGQLQEKFSDQIPVAIGAYNAGPVAMESWVSRNDGLRFDEFVEEIAYEGARTYIKRVLETMLRYEIAWGDPETLQSDTLGGLFPHTITGEFGDQVDF